MTVGSKSRLQNLPLLSCNTSDISEANLQLSLSSFSQELRSSGAAGRTPCFSADLNCKVSGPTVDQDWSLQGLNTNELWKCCFWNSKSFSRPQSPYRELPCGSGGCAYFTYQGFLLHYNCKPLSQITPGIKCRGTVTFMCLTRHETSPLWSNMKKQIISTVVDEFKCTFQSHYRSSRLSCYQDWVFFSSVDEALLFLRRIVTQKWLKRLL